VHIFRNIKSILIRKIFRRDIDKISNRNTIEITTRTTSIYRLTLNNNNISIIYFRNSC